MKKSIWIILIILILVGAIYLIEYKKEIPEKIVQISNNENVLSDMENTKDSNEEQDESILVSSQVTIELKDIDGKEKNYSFLYKGESFNATFSYGSWRIENSFKIRNKKDIISICQALIDVHPVHGSDGVSYRNAGDMAYEWLQHNLAYEILPEDNAWKNNAKNVDLDPKDQYKSLKEIYEDRTGKKLF